MMTRTYSGVIVALTYGQVYGYSPSYGTLADALDDLAAIDVYSDTERCPATERCPVSPHVARPIVVEVVS